MGSQDKRLKDTLNKHEGFELEVYKDSTGKLTVGRGHLVLPEDNLKLGDKISKSQAELFYNKDISDAKEVARNFVPSIFDDLSPTRQNVLTNMSYNLGGNKLNEFKKFKGALQTGDYDLASKEMLDSKWSNQVGRRSNQLSDRMVNNIWGSQIPWYKNAWWFAGDQVDKLRNKF